MSLQNVPSQNRLDLANALARLETQVRRAVYEKDVHLVARLDQDVTNLIPFLQAVATA